MVSDALVGRRAGKSSRNESSVALRAIVIDRKGPIMDDAAYHRERANAELLTAARATDPAAKAIHLRLASLHRTQARRLGAKRHADRHAI